jgi:hypothetical protein
MARRFGPLNERQVAVLSWIAEGCPDGIMEGDSYKVSAVALQDRGLIQVSRRRGVWQAEVTAGGRYYVLHGAFPDEDRLPSKSATGSKRAAPPASWNTPEISPEGLLSRIAQYGAVRVPVWGARTRSGD